MGSPGSFSSSPHYTCFFFFFYFFFLNSLAFFLAFRRRHSSPSLGVRWVALRIPIPGALINGESPVSFAVFYNSFSITTGLGVSLDSCGHSLSVAQSPSSLANPGVTGWRRHRFGQVPRALRRLGCSRFSLQEGPRARICLWLGRVRPRLAASAFAFGIRLALQLQFVAVFYSRWFVCWLFLHINCLLKCQKNYYVNTITKNLWVSCATTVETHYSHQK